MEPEVQGVETAVETQEERIAQTSTVMDFPDAIRELTIGKRIQRLEWHDSEYGILKDGMVMIHRNEKDYLWNLSNGDILADDWVSF